MQDSSFQRRLKADGLIGAHIFGPVQSRRYGVSLGVNLLPVGRKVCNFNCCYCECGWTTDDGSNQEQFPAADQILSAASAALQDCCEQKTILDAVTLAGNGEPTLHPQFSFIAWELRKMVDQLDPVPNLVLLSNGSRFDQTSVRTGLDAFSERVVKLDAVTPELRQQVNAPFEQVDLLGLLLLWREIGALTVQTCFVQGACDNTGTEAINEWISILEIVQPTRVQIYSIERPPANPQILVVPASRLREIAVLLLQRTGLSAQVY